MTVRMLNYSSFVEDSADMLGVFEVGADSEKESNANGEFNYSGQLSTLPRLTTRADLARRAPDPLIPRFPTLPPPLSVVSQPRSSQPPLNPHPSSSGDARPPTPPCGRLAT